MGQDAAECTAPHARGDRGPARHRREERRPSRRGQLRELAGVAVEEGGAAAWAIARVGHLAIRPDPDRRVVGQVVAERQEPSHRQAELVPIEVGRGDLGAEQGPPVLPEGELGEGELVVPAQQLAVGAAVAIRDRGRVVDVDDEGGRRIEDEGHRDIETPATVETQVPGRDSVARVAGRRLEPELGQPALDLLGGWYGVARRQPDRPPCRPARGAVAGT